MIRKKSISPYFQYSSVNDSQRSLVGKYFTKWRLRSSRMGAGSGCVRVRALENTQPSRAYKAQHKIRLAELPRKPCPLSVQG